MQDLFKRRKAAMNYDNPVDHQELDKRLQKTVRLRFVVLIVVISLLFSSLIFRLYQIQVVDYRTNLALANQLGVATNSALNPRGEIVDRYGQVLASNQEVLSIVYIMPTFDSKDPDLIWEKAKRFNELFDVEIDHLIFRDYQDAYIIFREEESKDLITQEEYTQYYANELSDSQIYALKVSRVTQAMINQLTDEEIQVFSIYQKMSIIPGMIKVIKEDANPQEVALLLDHIEEFAGFDVQVDWQRQYASNHSLSAIVGSLYTKKQGLPSNLLMYYQAQDYNVKDQVGRMGLEAMYQTILSGEKSIYTRVFDEEGYAQIQTIYPGKKGSTLKTTFDLEFQNYLEDQTETFMKSRESINEHRYFSKMYLVVSDPRNGDILANIAMFRDKEGNYYNSSNSTYIDSYPPGSAIKGAVVYMALDKELMKPGETIVDAPIKIKDTPEKSSFRNLGPVDDLSALAYSSNVYMWYAVIRLGDGNYEYNQPLYLNDDVVDIMRQYYSMFGLGESTQLDVTNEGVGYKSNTALTGNLLDFAIGQYDTYTVMQLNQYINTIANGEYRRSLRFVSEAFDPLTNEVVLENTIQNLNSIDNRMAIERVQEGFRLCVTQGYCTFLNDASIPAAAKTGTAQDFPRDPYTDTLILDDEGQLIEVTTNTIVAYAPYDNPEIAISCIAPFYSDGSSQANGCSQLVKDAVNYYGDNR